MSETWVITVKPWDPEAVRKPCFIGPNFRLKIHLDSDMPVIIHGFNSVNEALEQGVEWEHRLWCSVWLDDVEVANEYPRESLDPSDPECTAYKHVIPWVGN